MSASKAISRGTACAHAEREREQSEQRESIARVCGVEQSKVSGVCVCVCVCVCSVVLVWRSPHDATVEDEKGE